MQEARSKERCEIGRESTAEQSGAGFYLVLARRLCQRYYTADSQGREGSEGQLASRIREQKWFFKIWITCNTLA